MKINIIIPDTTKIGSFTKAEKRIWIKPTSKRKGHYRRITGAKKVEEKHSQLISGFKDMTYYYDFENYDEINEILLKQKDEDEWLPAFENMIINIAGEPHYFVAEAWYDGCLESRDYGPDTNPTEIKESFKGIAQEETKLGVLDHAEYLPDSNMAQYGISYVTKKVPRDLHGQFDISQFKISEDETEKIEINKDEKVMENYHYYYEKDREYIKVFGYGDDPHNMDFIKWESSEGAKGILKQLDEIKVGYSPSIGFIEFIKYPDDIYIQISKLTSLYKDGWREGESNLPIENDLKKNQSTKRVYVKPSKRAKGYYREQKIGREEIDPKIENFWDIPINKFSKLISGDKIKLKEKYILAYSYKLNDDHPELQKLLDLMDPTQSEWKLPTPIDFHEREGVSPHSISIFRALGEHKKVPLHVLKDYPEAAYSYEIDITDEALEQEPPQGKIEHLYEMPKDQYDTIIAGVSKDYNKDPNKVTDSMLNNKYPEELADIKAAAKLRKKIFNNLPKFFRVGWTPETMNEKLHYDVICQMKKDGKNISKEVKADYPMVFEEVPVNFESTNNENINKEINGILEELKLAVGDLKMGSDKDLDNIIMYIINSSGELPPIYIMDEDHDKEKLINSGIDDISKILNPKLLDKIKKSNIPIRIRSGSDIERSNYNEGVINLDDRVVNSEKMQYDPNTFCHEYGHAIEDMIPEIKDLCKEFLNKRTENEVAISLRDISKFYDAWEYTKVDHFVEPYIGKQYDEATEVLSMGMGYLTTGFYSMRLYKQDPEFLGFILAIVSGKIGLNDKKESL